MIIVAGYSLAKSVVNRDASVAAFAEMVGRARQQDGCIDMAISADSIDPTRSNIVEIWRDEAAVAAERAEALGAAALSRISSTRAVAMTHLPH